MSPIKELTARQKQTGLSRPRNRKKSPITYTNYNLNKLTDKDASCGKSQKFGISNMNNTNTNNFGVSHNNNTSNLYKSDNGYEILSSQDFSSRQLKGDNKTNKENSLGVVIQREIIHDKHYHEHHSTLTTNKYYNQANYMTEKTLQHNNNSKKGSNGSNITSSVNHPSTSKLHEDKKSGNANRESVGLSVSKKNDNKKTNEKNNSVTFIPSSNSSTKMDFKKATIVHGHLVNPNTGLKPSKSQKLNTGLSSINESHSNSHSTMHNSDKKASRTKNNPTLSSFFNKKSLNNPILDIGEKILSTKASKKEIRTSRIQSPSIKNGNGSYCSGNLQHNPKFHKTASSSDRFLADHDANSVNVGTSQSKKIAKQVKIAELERKLFTTNFKHNLLNKIFSKSKLN